MSSDPKPAGGDAERPPPLPLAADRPVVDGTGKTAAQIRAELAALLAEDRERAAAERRDGGAPAPVRTVADAVRARSAGARPPAPATGALGPAAARLQQRVERARISMPERATALADGARQRPAVTAAAALVMLAVIVLAIRRHRG